MQILVIADVTGSAVLKAHFVESDGDRYVAFNSAKVDVTVKDYSIRVDKLFPDKQLSKYPQDELCFSDKEALESY